jgi:hypothetical protein
MFATAARVAAVNSRRKRSYIVSAAGSATISNIVAPVTSEDGQPITDLANMRIDYGQVNGGPYPNSGSLLSSTATSGTITGLAAGTWYFVIAAIDSAGQVSGYSQQFSKTIT